MRKLSITVIVCLLGTASRAIADVKLASVFTDHMVLQQGMPIPVWGTADPGEEVTVTLGTQKGHARAGADGKWLLRLEPLKAGGGPLELSALGKNAITLADVLVGEVWLCSGQSNMEFTVSKAKKYFAGTVNEKEEIASAKWPQIRMFNVKMSTQQTPQTAVAGQWRVCSPETVGDFSAVGYFMARKLHQDLNVPIGVINTSYGASTAQAWISKEMLQGDRYLIPYLDSNRKKPGDQHNPFVLYNAMLAPLIPYAMRGVAWYQGESIATNKGALSYRHLMSALIRDWRQRWGQSDFPFLIVQLPNLKTQNFTNVREEQVGILEAANTFLTVNIDIGDPKDVHPHNKQEFGRRLALVAEKEVYAKNVVCQGPIFQSMTIAGGEARIRFTSQDNRLTVKGDKLLGFVIAGPDGRFEPADARIEQNEVVVSSPKVPMPAQVRYAWEGWPIATLTNGSGLPAWPFRTDGPKIPARVTAQNDKDKIAGDAMIEKYLAAEADKLSKKYLDGAKTIDEWKEKRPRLYQEYMDMLGLWPVPEKTPLHATKTGEVEAYGVVVEKIHFQSKPGLYVTANLYRPRDNSQKRPAIVYVCGHSFKGRDGNKSAHQDHGFWYANNGYVCIVLDSLQLGEIPGVHHGTWGQPWRHISSYRGSQERERQEHPEEVFEKLPEDKLENRFWWHAIGYSPAAVECWNGVRAIDYLCSRPDVDPDKIGVTGISGGGAATFWIAAADERIKVAAPVSGMSDLESYVKNKVVNGHCDCMFLYNTYQWDWTTIAAMIAPRPLLFANSDNDTIFPMDGNRRVIAKLRKIYGMYDKPDLVDEYVSSGGHAYRPDLRVAVFKFLNKHLKGDTTTPVEDCAKYTPLDASKMRVFPLERDLPKDALNERIDEFFIPMAKVKLPAEGRFGEWKSDLIKELREKSFRALPNRIPAATLPQEPKSWEAWELTTESNIVTQSVLIQQAAKNNPKTATLVVWDERDIAKKSKNWPFDEAWVAPHVPTNDIGTFVATRGVLGMWDSNSPPNYVKRAHVLMGRTVDEGRVWDICAEIAWSTKKWKIEGHRVVGKGQAGILAAYAALLEPSIKEVVVIDPPKSHKEGPYFLNVLRVLDIPEALGLLAPTPLTIIGGSDAAFDRTAEIYRLAGAADKLKRR